MYVLGTHGVAANRAIRTRLKRWIVKFFFTDHIKTAPASGLLRDLPKTALTIQLKKFDEGRILLVF